MPLRLFPRIQQRQKYRRYLRLTTAVSLTCLAISLHPFHLSDSQVLSHSAQAHQVEIVEDVGATLHVEPNDTPRAGEEVLAWFALTRKGGKTIPLSDCDCALTVTAQANEAVLLTPNLSPVDAEGYVDIPGARFTFPSVGVYNLLLRGSPANKGDFTPFELDFEMTVAAGVRLPSPTEAPSPTPDEVPDTVAAEDSVAADIESLASSEGKPAEQRALPLWIWIFPGGAVALILLALRNRQQS